MSAESDSPGGNLRTRIGLPLLLWTSILFVVAVLLVYLVARMYGGSERYLTGLEATSAGNEKAGEEALLMRLAKLNALDRAKVISAAISSDIFDATIQQFAGQEMHFKNDSLGEVAIRLDKLRTEFRDGFPRLACDGTLTANGTSIAVKTVGIFEPELQGDAVLLHVKCLGLAPKGRWLPRWAGTIANAGATKAVNDELEKHSVAVPIGREIKEDTGSAKSFTQWVKTPNGRVQIEIIFPPLQVTRSLQPKEVFFTRDGIHIIADVKSGAQEASAVPAPALQPAASGVAAALDRWRLAPNEGFRFTIGREIVLTLLREVTTWPEANRTVTVHGVKEEGHLMDRTGGAPFGNGFGAWLDGPDRLQASAILRNVTADWQPQTQSIVLSSQIAVQGHVRVHVHGNAPHIDPPRIFGHPIGGGVTIGGGAGTSVEARIDPDPTPYGLKAAFRLTPDPVGFDVRLMEPEELSVKLTIGGVPEELQYLFGIDGFRVPLPRDAPIYAFPAPTVIAETVNIPLPEMKVKTLGIQLKHLKAGMDSEGLTISGGIELSGDHAESEAH